MAVENFEIKSKGHRTWTDDEIESYRQRYPIGTEQRLAFELLLNTGQSVSDTVKMGRKHIRDGCITITQKKSGGAVEVTIPILPALQMVLDDLQARRIAPTFLLNQYGAARSERGLSTQFIEWRNKAGLPDDLHAHGLRKAFCRVAAEAGLTPHEIMSLSGHKTLHEVMRYTAAVDRKKLARAVETLAKMPSISMGVDNLNGSSRAASACWPKLNSPRVAPMSLTLLAPPPEPVVSASPSLTREQKRQIRETFAIIEPASDLVARLFYLKSVDLDPSLRNLFKSPNRVQRRKFMAAMKVAVLSLDRFQSLQPILRLLGTRQREEGVTPSHYETFQRAWVWTLEQSLGSRFPREANEAWSSLLNEMTRATAS